MLVGPDGAGKTTVAAEVMRRVGGSCVYFHFLPDSVWRRGPATEPRPGELVAKHTGSGSRLLGVVRLLRNLVKAWIAWVRVLRPAVRSGSLVVGDRYLYGYLAQPTPLKFYGPRWLARLVVGAMPQPDLVVLLEAPVPVLRGRKAEVSEEDLRRELRLWATVPGPVIRLDATRPPGRLAELIVDALALPHRAYPPARGNVVVPRRPRPVVRVGASLYGPSRRRGLLAHRAAQQAIRALGSGWLPVVGPDRVVDPELWSELASELRRLGIQVEHVALYRRSQRGRSGFSLLAMDGDQATAFVKVGGDEIAREAEVLELVAAKPPTTFVAPRVVAAGNVSGVQYAVLSPLPAGIHVPDFEAPIDEICAEIGATLSVLRARGDRREGWEPMHGDLTPWNLRRHGRIRLLFDWERAAWGPPKADQTLYWAACRALGRRRGTWRPPEEAAAFWLQRLGTPGSAREARLHRAMRRELEAVFG